MTAEERELASRSIAHARREGWTVRGSIAKGIWRVSQGGDVHDMTVDQLAEFTGEKRP